MNAIIDTSMFISLEAGIGAAKAPTDGAISVMTLAELHRGAVAARNGRARSRRLQTLADVERTFEALPVDRDVALKYAELVAHAARLGNRPHVIDGLIAATAAVHGVPVYTRDHDFDKIPGLEVVRL